MFDSDINARTRKLQQFVRFAITLFKIRIFCIFFDPSSSCHQRFRGKIESFEQSIYIIWIYNLKINFFFFLILEHSCANKTVIKLYATFVNFLYEEKEIAYRKYLKIVNKNYSSSSCEIFIFKKQCLVSLKKKVRRRRRRRREIKINTIVIL